MYFFLLGGLFTLLIEWRQVEASLPCNEILRDLTVPCKCDVKPVPSLDQGVGIIVDCDRIVFSGDLPVLPPRSPIIEFR